MTTALALAALVLAPAALAGTYTDPTADGRGAPDVGVVTVTSSRDSRIAFRIGVDDLRDRAGVRILLALDTDMNPATGAVMPPGADYLFAVTPSDDSYSFWALSGLSFENALRSTVSVHSDDGGTTISVNRRELGNTTELDFWTETTRGEGAFDLAPDVGPWNYSLAANGPDILGAFLQQTPSSPRHGRRFGLRPTRLKLPLAATPPPDSYRCSATLARRPLVGHGQGGCAWAVPRGSRGKTLVVTLTVSYQGATKSFPYVFRVG